MILLVSSFCHCCAVGRLIVMGAQRHTACLPSIMRETWALPLTRAPQRIQRI